MPRCFESRDFWLHVILTHVRDLVMCHIMPFSGIILPGLFSWSWAWLGGSSPCCEQSFFCNCDHKGCFAIMLIKRGCAVYWSHVGGADAHWCTLNGLFRECNPLKWFWTIVTHQKNPQGNLKYLMFRLTQQRLFYTPIVKTFVLWQQMGMQSHLKCETSSWITRSFLMWWTLMGVTSLIFLPLWAFEKIFGVT